MRHTSLIAGCYEKTLFGFELLSTDKGIELQTIFNNVAHEGCIKAVSSQQKWLVSGSTDETIKIYNLQQKVELGSLYEHKGISIRSQVTLAAPITCLEFFGKYLLSGSEDGALCLWTIKDWNCLLSMKEHKGGVLSASVHPSGVVALSTAKDKTLKMWNLVTGKCSFTTQLEKIGDKIIWSPQGKTYALLTDTKITLFNDKASTLAQIPYKSRVHTVIFVKESLLAFGGEDHTVCIWDLDSNTCLHSWTAHSNRIKDLCLVPYTPANLWLASISSDGFLKLWDIQDEPALLAETDTTARLTCLTVASYSDPGNQLDNINNNNKTKNKKRKVEKDEIEEENK